EHMAWGKVMASVADLVRPPERSHPALGAVAMRAEPLLAVLAFDNLSGDPEMTYFSDGVSEEILDTVTRGRTRASCASARRSGWSTIGARPASGLSAPTSSPTTSEPRRGRSLARPPPRDRNERSPGGEARARLSMCVVIPHGGPARLRPRV